MSRDSSNGTSDDDGGSDDDNDNEWFDVHGVLCKPSRTS